MHATLFVLGFLDMGACLRAQEGSLHRPRPEPATGPQQTGREYAFLEVVAPRKSYFVQEPIRLTLRFGIDSQFLKNNMIQLFHQQLDVPVEVQVAWLADLPGAVLLQGREVKQGAASPKRLSFALNGQLTHAAQVQDRLEDGRRFTVLEIEKSYLPHSPGKLIVPGPSLQLAFASRFEEDFIKGRVAADRQDVSVRGKPITIEIKPLPEEGRPSDFGGAVGEFSVLADANPRALEVGASLKLQLRIEGEGNLEFFEAPRLHALEGFHVLGKIEAKSRTRRTVVYDLILLSEKVKEVPPISLAFFDPKPPGRYRFVQTQPIPLELRPRPEGRRHDPLPGSGDRPAVPGKNDIYDIKALKSPGVRLPGPGSALGLSPIVFVILFLSPWLLALWLRSRLRDRARRLGDPDRLRARSAAAAFRARASLSGTDMAEALTEYLAAQLHCSTVVVMAPDLKERLVEAGVSRELAVWASSLLDDLLEDRYGGTAAVGGVEAALALVEALEQSFLAAETLPGD